ncbi:hypothetical protein Tco_0283107 [Tanacetum coccineum]
MEQLLGSMEYLVDTLMKDAISLMGKSENLCGLSSNTMRQLPPEPWHQEAFKGLVINFVLDQEEKVCQLEEYMCIIGSDFMQLPLEVVEKLKEEIRLKENNSKRIQKITRYLDTEDLDPLKGKFFSESLVENASFCTPKSISPKSLYTMSKRTWQGKSTRGKSSSSKGSTMEGQIREFRVFDNETHQLNFHSLSRRPIHSESVIDWSFLANHSLNRSFFKSINTDNFYRPQWANLFHINESVYRELVREFFASIEFDATACRVGLYSQDLAGENITRSGLRKAVTVKAEHLLMEFWPTIRDGEEMIDALSVEPRAHDFKKKSLITIRVIMELDGGAYYWPATRQVREDDEVEEAAEKGVGGSFDVYLNMNKGDWQVHKGQWMGQMDGRWGQMESWMARQDELYLRRRSPGVLRSFMWKVLG